jgi:glycosyltransferase involved in cell wall biosynthesis
MVTPQKPRLAFINTDALSFNNLMRGQLEYLHSLGAELDLYCGGPKTEQDALIARGIGTVRNVPFRRPPHPLWDLISLIALTAMLGRRRYDAVIYSTPKALLLGALAALLTRQKRRIAWFRGRAYENMHGGKRKAFVAFDRLTIACSHQVLFVSPSLREAYRSDGLDPGGKGSVVGFGSSNGVDVERFRPLESPAARAKARAAVGLSAEDFVILVVGRIAPDKGIAQVLELARRLSDVGGVRFLFVGGIEDARLGDEVVRPKDRRVRWHPPTREAQTFYQLADLNLLLSSREGLPNVALEAAATGVPTFAWDVVGVRDAVADGVTGRLFPFGDLDALETAVRAAAHEPASLRAQFADARQFVAKRFPQDGVWRSYADIFLGRARGRAASVTRQAG